MTDRCDVAYRGVRERVTGIVAALDRGADEAPVPATPSWRIHDLLAHLVGVSRDAVEGRLDGVSTDAWTAAQVERRRDAATEALLAEWDEYGPRFERRLGRLPDSAAGRAVLDAVSHEHDLRQATGLPGARASDAVSVAFDWACGARPRSTPALRFVTEAGERVAGECEPVATVTATRFELLRASTGRRTREEVVAYGWDGPCDPGLLLHGAVFAFRDETLREC
jgi:uncharacterized protein (TIGR03083 family)